MVNYKFLFQNYLGPQITFDPRKNINFEKHKSSIFLWLLIARLEGVRVARSTMGGDD